MMPDPTTAASSIAVPVASATSRRLRLALNAAWPSGKTLLLLSSTGRSSPSLPSCAWRTARASGGCAHHVQLTKGALKLLSIVGRRRNAGQRLDSAVHHCLRGGVQRSRNPVMHPHTVAPNVDQSGPPQVREVARYGGLRQSKAVVNVAHAHF